MSVPWIPWENQVFLPAHTKQFTCMALNSKANRLVTGGRDSVVKLWDFQGLTSSLRSFKQINPLNNHAVRSLCLHKSGQSVLIAPGGRHARLYTDSGDLLMQTSAGDMYLRDPAMTKGHTYTVVGCAWDPFNNEHFLTSSMDGTVRLWDSQARTFGLEREAESIGAWRAVDARGTLHRNCQITCSLPMPIQTLTSKSIVAGCSDGSVQIVNTSKKPGSKSDFSFRHSTLGHKGEVCGVLGGGHNGKMVYSRDMDNKILLWDVSNPKTPVAWSSCNVETLHETANMCLSPCGKYLVIVTSSLDKSDSSLSVNGEKKHKGDLVLLNSSSLEEVLRMPLPTGGVQVQWPSEIDQLFVGLTSGEVLCGWDEMVKEGQVAAPALSFMPDSQMFEIDDSIVRGSKKGVLLSIHINTKQDKNGTLDANGFDETIALGRVWTEEDWIAAGYREGREGGLRMTREARQKKYAKNMEAPGGAFSKWGAGGALATSSNLTEYLISGLASTDIRSGQEDAQKVLQDYALKMKQEGEDDTLIGTAYKRTQPKNILDTNFDDEDELEAMLGSHQKCSACGLKMCKCPPSLKNNFNKKARFGSNDVGI
eukprot:GDKJ01018219.1.p1 GENE.GDKJ01018219.1~~GDKJ01018219.1.p1  ORF type:complete len:593 (-),score=111.36 GDKJ01018219.1:95-1873(-)